MIDPGALQRLRRQTWTSIDSFAEELYAVLASAPPEPPGDRPLAIEATPDRPALRITAPRDTPATPSRSAPPLPGRRPVVPGPADRPALPSPAPYEAAARPEVALARARARESAADLVRTLRTPPPAAPTRTPPDLSVDYAAGTTPAPPPSYRPPPSVVSPLEPPSGSGSYATRPPPAFAPFEAGGATPTLATPLPPAPESPRPSFRPEAIELVPPPAPPEVSDYSAPYVNPAVEIDAPVAFKGKSPVQFETAPLLFDPVKGRYEAFHPRHVPHTDYPWMNRPGIVALTREDIEPASGSVPGQGAADFYYFDGFQFNVEPGWENQTLYNFALDTIENGSWVITQDINGYPFAVWQQCPAAGNQGQGQGSPNQ